MSNTPSLLQFIAPYLAQRASQFALKPAHPHRLLHDRPEPIATYHARLAAIYDRSAFGKPELLAELIRDIVATSVNDLPRTPSQTVFEACIHCVQALLIDNELAFDFPNLDRSLIHEDNYVVPLRRHLQQLEPILVYQEHIIETFANVASAILTATISDYLPDAAFSDDHSPVFTVPLFTLIKRPREFIEQLLATFISQEQYNTAEPYSFAFWNTRHQLFDNLLAASNLTLEQANKNPQKMILPRNSDLDINELVATCLANTPFLELLQTPVPFELTARFSHHHVVATPGAGKTNLIGVLLAKDFADVAKGAASVIVLDSQGDLINSIVRLKHFAPGGNLHDRLVYIDPTDIEHPLELNLFARRGKRALTPLEKRTEHSDLVDLLLFLFGALKQEATGRQETLIKAVASLIQEIPDATLMTLNTIFEPADKKKPTLQKFSSYLTRLDPAIQEFFAVDFNSTEFSQSRSQIRARLQSLITDPVFRAMFGATTQKLDFAHEMNSGKVILINAYEDLLKTGTEVFGRFFIALAGQAAQARQNIDERRRMPTYFYIDECYKFIAADTNVETILDTGRKYRLGVILAHQRLNQLSEDLKSAASSAAIKMVRAPIHEDARTLASQLNTSAEYFDALPDHAFAIRITGMRQPIAITVPLSPLATAEHMTDVEFAEVRNVMRRKYARADASLPNSPDQPITTAPAEPQASELSQGNTDLPLRPDVQATKQEQSPDPNEPLVKPGKPW